MNISKILMFSALLFSTQASFAAAQDPMAINDLSDDCICLIFNFLEGRDISSAMQVCKRWQKVLQTEIAENRILSPRLNRLQAFTAKHHEIMYKLTKAEVISINSHDLLEMFKKLFHFKRIVNSGKCSHTPPCKIILLRQINYANVVNMCLETLSQLYKLTPQESFDLVKTMSIRFDEAEALETAKTLFDKIQLYYQTKITPQTATQLLFESAHDTHANESTNDVISFCFDCGAENLTNTLLTPMAQAVIMENFAAASSIQKAHVRHYGCSPSINGQLPVGIIIALTLFTALPAVLIFFLGPQTFTNSYEIPLVGCMITPILAILIALLVESAGQGAVWWHNHKNQG